jgi:hypothetical protein
MYDIAASVERGMKFLDKHISNWIDAIDLERLALDGCTTCILGQLFKNFWTGLEHLKLDLTSTAAYFATTYSSRMNADALGFYRDDMDELTDDWDELTCAWNELTDAWVAAIKKRKEEQNV